MTAYYTAWVHQIKTPIAAMRLTLQGEDTPAARRLMTELGRVEQYVDMALTYLRLEEGGSDYVIRTCAVDDVVCAAVRRFAGEFIDRRIALDYTPVEWETVTDGKWLTFVVEQLLSNALKYTGQDGTVRIYREGDDLCIRDSGMGIAPEDLPRVFDMGYTGQNGRLDRPVQRHRAVPVPADMPQSAARDTDRVRARCGHHGETDAGPRRFPAGVKGDRVVRFW